MLPACMAIFYRALDARTYVQSERVPPAEATSRNATRDKWVHLIHYVATQGWVGWKDIEVQVEGDNVDENGEGAVGCQVDSTTDEENMSKESEGREDGQELQSEDGDDEDLPDIYCANGSRLLSFLDTDITAVLPHARYRGPVFYILNFACAVLSIAIDHRRHLAPVNVTIEKLAHELTRDFKDYLGPELGAILTELLLDIIYKAKYAPDDFDGVWPTLDLDEVVWYPKVDKSCIGFPLHHMKGRLWTIQPKTWLMDPESLDKMHTSIPKANPVENAAYDGEEMDVDGDVEAGRDMIELNRDFSTEDPVEMEVDEEEDGIELAHDSAAGMPSERDAEGSVVGENNETEGSEKESKKRRGKKAHRMAMVDVQRVTRRSSKRTAAGQADGEAGPSSSKRSRRR